MPGPDPFGLDIEEHDNGGFGITCELWAHGHRAPRIGRMLAVARNIRRNGWMCAWCHEPIPLYRRADARFCREVCRKKSARARRRARS